MIDQILQNVPDAHLGSLLYLITLKKKPALIRDLYRRDQNLAITPDHLSRSLQETLLAPVIDEPTVEALLENRQIGPAHLTQVLDHHEDLSPPFLAHLTLLPISLGALLKALTTTVDGEKRDIFIQALKARFSYVSLQLIQYAHNFCG